MVVDLAGRPILSSQKPSAETLLHTHLYRSRPDIGAVLHTHSLPATVLTRYWAGRTEWMLSDFELQKAFRGQVTHDSALVIPIFENSQNIEALAVQADSYLSMHPDTPGYLIRGHGLYTWGESMTECLRHIEAMEFLLACELELCRLERSN